MLKKIKSLLRLNQRKEALKGLNGVSKAVDTCTDAIVSSLKEDAVNGSHARARHVLTALLVNNLPEYRGVTKDDLLYAALAAVERTDDMGFIKQLYNNYVSDYMTEELLRATDAKLYKDRARYANNLVGVYRIIWSAIAAQPSKSGTS